MRPFVTKHYRAFPELDHLSDAESEQYMAQARRMAAFDGRRSDRALAAISILAPIALILLSCLGSEWLLRRLLSDSGHVRPAWFAAFVGVVGCVIIGSTLIRDWRLHRLLRRRVAADRCRACGHSILGASCEFGVMKCCKCGAPFEPGTIGLEPQDFRTFERGCDGTRVPVPKVCPECRGQLFGAWIARGGLNCPHCAVRVPVTRLLLSRDDYRRHEILESLNGTIFPFPFKCPACEYPLRGLTVSKSGVVCPECAAVSIVHGFEYTRPDLMSIERKRRRADPPVDHPTSASPSDSP